MNNVNFNNDREQVIRHASLKGYQALSLLTPPIYTGFLLWRKGRAGFSIARVLRATWIGSLAGTALGGAAAAGRLRNETVESIHDRRVRLIYNVGFYDVEYNSNAIESKISNISENANTGRRL